jgi:aspartate oxidase
LCEDGRHEWVHVHPTGHVKPVDPDAEGEFLAAGVLRGAGGLAFNANGDRLASELGRQGSVTGKVFKSRASCAIYRLKPELIHLGHWNTRRPAA